MCKPLLILLTLLISFPGLAHAQENTKRIEVDFGYEIPLTLLGLVFWTSPMLIEDELIVPEPGELDRDKINFIDQGVVDLNVSWARNLSHGLAAATPLLAATGTFFIEDDTRSFFEDSLIALEAITITGILNQVTRHAFPRPRPYLYSDDPSGRENGTMDDYNSFFSGHTANVFASTTAFLMMQQLRNPDASWLPWAWVGGMSLASSVGLMRILAGDHFVSDVVVGMAVGVGVGISLPLLHFKESNMSLSGSVGTDGLVIGFQF